MKTILVTGVGALIGQGILQALNNSADRQDIHLIGLDLNKETHARHLCDYFIQKPSLEETSDEYRNFWLNIIREHNVELILPGIENDVVFFNRQREASVEIPVLLNSPDILLLGLDKFALFEFSRKHNILSIPSVLASNALGIKKLGLHNNKIIAKPRASNGSRGIFRFEKEEELRNFVDNKSRDELNGFILQPHIGSDSEEYTASIFGFGDGSHQGPIVFKRTLAKEGYTKYAKTVTPPDEILLTIEAIDRKCHAIGPTNFQFRKEDDRYFLMEINPRFSSTTSLKSLFGFDETKMAVNYFFKGEKNYQINLLQGEAWRYICDFVKYS